VDRAALGAVPPDRALLDRERQVPDRLVLERPVRDQRALGQPGLAEPLRDQLPLVPQAFDRLVHEVAEPVLQAELIAQRAVLIAH
jgi:hypothetical protein